MEHRDYVDRLGRVLVGSRAGRRDLLREVADHLEDATEAHVAAGLAPEAAARRAQREFGTVAELAPSYQAVLATGLLRRATVVLLLSLLVQPLAWAGGDEEGAGPRAALSAALSRLVETVGMLTIAAAILTLLATGVGRRWFPVGTGFVRAAATTALAASVTIIAISAGMHHAAGGPDLTEGLFAVAVVGVPFSWVGWQAARCLRSLAPARGDGSRATPA